MYTECPDCRTTFRLTAQVLRQAGGQVRCGGCGTTFNAIEHLSEELPGDEPSPTQTVRAFDEQSRELLESLDHLAGRDVARIEDTGVEWRVLDIEDASDNDGGDAPPPDLRSPAADDTGIRWTLEEPGAEGTAADNDGGDTVAQPLDEVDEVDEVDGDEIPVLDNNALPAGGTADAVTPEGPTDSPATADDRPDAAAQGALDLQEDTAGDGEEPMRFDDHTPLPDDFYKPSEQPGFRDTTPPAEDIDEGENDAAARAAATQADLALDDEDDWEDLLAEVGDESGDGAADDADSEVAVAPGAGDEVEALAEATGDPGDETPATMAADRTDEEPPAAAAGSNEEDDELARSMAIEIDQELMRAAAEASAHADDKAASTSPPAPADDRRLVETIIMEGDTVTDLLMDAEQATLDADSGPEPHDDEQDEEHAAAAHAPDRRRRNLGIAAVVVLGLALAAQLVHANRAALATWDGFETTLGPVYRALGRPVTPAWDVRGWQFESTSGSTDASDQRLTIYSRIANRGEQALPYPLVHVALTDRFEEVVGSRVLAPAEYLAGSGSPGRPVLPGASFTAVIAVDAPSPDATGFKLNVCYPVTGDAVRCAIEDFRD